MNKKIIYFLFCILLVASIANAAKVTQTFSGGDIGLELRIPPAEFVKQNEDIQSNMHVFNKSSGFLMTNETTSCLFHIYNKSGNHIASENMEYEDEDDDFFLDVDKGNFSDLGFLSFIIQCNTSNEGGFVSGSVEVTHDGKERKDVLPIVFVLILVSMLFIIFGIVVLLFMRQKK